MTIHDVSTELVMRQRVEGKGNVHQRLHQVYEDLMELPLHGGNQTLQQPLYHVNNRESGEVTRNLRNRASTMDYP